VAPSPETAISTRLLLRLIIVFVAAWTLLHGVVLLGFSDAAEGALGLGISDPAGQRITGALLLVLVPAYILVALRIDRYAAFVWLPLAAQVTVALTTAWSVLAGDTSFSDGVLTCVVSGFCGALLAYVWIAEQRMVATGKLSSDDSDVEADRPAGEQV
jgi:hypothetical protein